MAPGPHTPPFHVLAVENVEIIRSGLHNLPISHPDVVASIRIHDHVTDIDFEQTPPQVVVLDYWLGRSENEPSIPFVPQIKRWAPFVVLFTAERAPYLLQEAMGQGIDALCLKTDGIGPLVEAIRSAGSDDVPLSSPLAKALLAHDALGAHLTPIEIETLRGLSLGFSNAEIASRRNVAAGTVNTQVESVRRKYAATYGRSPKRNELSDLGRRDGYVGLESDHEDPRFTR